MSTTLGHTTTRLGWPVWVYFACIMLPIRFTIGPLQMTGLRLYVLMLIPFLLYKLAQRDRVSVDFLLFFFVLWTYVAMVVNTPAQAVEHAGITLLELYGGYAIARCYITTAALLQRLIKTLTWLILCCLPLAVFETLTGRPIVVEAIAAVPGLASVDVVTIAPRLGLERVQAVFAHPIHFGLFCSTAISLLFIGLSDCLTATKRIMGLAIIVVTAFLALSSGAFLSILIQVFLIGWALLFAKLPHKWVWLLLGCGAAYVFVDLISNRTPIRVFFSYATFSAHNAYWRGLIFEWGMVNVFDNPVFGIGLNEWVRPHFMHSGSMDNFWLAVAVRYGLPGFALLAVAWIVGIARVAKSNASGEPLKTAWLFCMLGLTFTLCTVHVWTAVYSFVFFLLGAGQFLASSRTQPLLLLDPKGPFQRQFRASFTRSTGTAS